MKKIFIFFISLIVFSTLVSATTQISIYLDESGRAQFLGETTEYIELPAGINIENGNIRGTTQELTSKQGDVWRFSYSLTNSELNIILPEGAEITKLSSGEISLYDSRLAIYVPGNIDVYYKVNEVASSKGYWGIILAAIIVGTIYFVWKKNKRNEKNKLSKTDHVFKILNDREKKIIEELKKVGKIKSSYLRRLCEIPKASFSRHLHELERKKLVKLSGEGKNKFVDLV